MKYDECAILDYCGRCKHIVATIATLPYCRKLHKHYLRRINRKKNCPHFQEKETEMSKKKSKKKKKSKQKNNPKKAQSIKPYKRQGPVSSILSDYTGWDV